MQHPHVFPKRIIFLLMPLFFIVGCIPLLVTAQDQPTDSECHAAFVEYMNTKAAFLDMNNTKFRDPIGMNNLTTARDFLRLLVLADTYDVLADVWAEEEYTLNVGGDSAREKVVRSTIRGNEHLDPYYTILGCKDGELTGPNLRNLVAILKIPGSDNKLAVVALGAYGRNEQANGSRAAVRQIADAAMLRYNDPTWDYSSTEISCQSGIACLIPAEGVDMDNLHILFERNIDQQFQTASIAKIMTALCLLDVQENLEETFTYHYFDSQIGGFYDGDFYTGDILTFHEALYALMLPSSNTTARALAREGGKIILANGIPEQTMPPAPTEPPATESDQDDIPDPTLPQREAPHLR